MHFIFLFLGGNYEKEFNTSKKECEGCEENEVFTPSNKCEAGSTYCPTIDKVYDSKW